MGEFERKILCFGAAMADIYRNQEDRESTHLKLELKEEDLTEDFTAMVYAQWILYRSITDNNIDILEFTHILNRLIVQRMMEEPEGNSGDKWIDVDEELPKDDSYILVSFDNHEFPDIARYKEDENGGAFYPRGDEMSYVQHGVVVNAWKPLPKKYSPNE